MAPTGKTKKDSPERIRFMIRRNALLTLQPVFVAAAVMGLWYVARHNHLYFTGEDVELMALTVFVLTALVYIFIAGFIFTEVWQKQKAIVQTIMKDNLDGFLLLRDERTPAFALTTVGSLSVLMVSIVGTMHWHETPAGFFAVGASAFVVAKIWVLITRLDDPKKSPWIEERVDPRWWTADVDKHFSLDGKSQRSPMEEIPVG